MAARKAQKCLYFGRPCVQRKIRGSINTEEGKTHVGTSARLRDSVMVPFSSFALQGKTWFCSLLYPKVLVKGHGEINIVNLYRFNRSAESPSEHRQQQYDSCWLHLMLGPAVPDGGPGRGRSRSGAGPPVPKLRLMDCLRQSTAG